MNDTKIWRFIAILEAIAVLFVVVARSRVVVNVTPVSIHDDPLHLALEYEAPDAKFEQLVKEHPEWIFFRPTIKGAYNTSILEDAAMAGRTNYVRILIANGADVQRAVEILKRHEESEAINLIENVQSETRPMNPHEQHLSK